MSSSRIALAACVLAAALASGSWGVVRAFPLASIDVVPDIAPQPVPVHDKAIALEKQSASVQQTRTTPGQLPPPPRPAREMPPPPPPPPPSGDMPESFIRSIERLHPLRIGGSIVAPIKLKDVRPRYPEDALAAKIEGEVTLEAIVDGEGRVADARVVDGVPELNEAALSAVKQWEFKPTLLNGEPTAIIFTCTVTFRVR